MVRALGQLPHGGIEIVVFRRMRAVEVIDKWRRKEVKVESECRATSSVLPKKAIKRAPWASSSPSPQG